MSSTFTPSNVIDMSKEKEWSVGLGMLDWDTTNIVFTKRSLIEFLKYTGTTVDTNFGNIQKLPKYAKFGKMSAGVASSESTSSITTSTSATAEEEAFKPSRRVRQVPGGAHTELFGENEVGDALSTAPPKEIDETEVGSPPITQEEVQEEDEHTGINFTSHVKPSRRVRTVPGGRDSLSNFWDSNEQQEEFKPTRRVRQIPGGQDNISGIF